MYSAYKLNKQSNNLQPWHTPLPIWSQSVVPCLVLTVSSWPEYRFLRRQIRWSGIPISKSFPQFIVIDTVKGFSVVDEAEVDAFLELSCFFYDPADIGNLISGSFAFSKSSLNNWTFWSLAWRILSNLIMEEEMATHPGILSWENSQTEEPGGLQSMKSQRVRHDLAT